MIKTKTTEQHIINLKSDGTGISLMMPAGQESVLVIAGDPFSPLPPLDIFLKKGYPALRGTGQLDAVTVDGHQYYWGHILGRAFKDSAIDLKTATGGKISLPLMVRVWPVSGTGENVTIGIPNPEDRAVIPAVINYSVERRLFGGVNLKFQVSKIRAEFPDGALEYRVRGRRYAYPLTKACLTGEQKLVIGDASVEVAAAEGYEQVFVIQKQN